MRFFVFLTTLSLIAGSMITAWGGNLIPHKVKAKRRCSLGNRYRYQATTSTPVTSVTYTVLNLSNTEVDANTNRTGDESPLTITKIYQQSTQNMTLDHCSISNAAVVLEEDGNWSINFRATQDPNLVPNTLQPVYRRFRRNKFFVTIRGLGSASTVSTTESDRLGRPVLFSERLEGFWVEQGQTRFRYIKSQHENQGIQKFYNNIHRIELLFHYE